MSDMPSLAVLFEDQPLSNGQSMSFGPEHVSQIFIGGRAVWTKEDGLIVDPGELQGITEAYGIKLQ